ncbi:TPA: BlaI/MecI/CopY family transcriptional regulator [Clostridioides difficile]|uniref:BlaI/MecI/CopY family transcriptional regulator n=1 Tax=Clostridioides difficile TaxID=1496 RepID=UPI0003B28B7B|nr:BlaI/MecI/CopY family transcriptional regulator [Clostridioides difficile]EGT4047643.1 BlaI/MecI/CopY family transcriptional regulator [Clostridioides difficile]EGT4050156.1 BlaI/MecI/CopY family transcriptional regulator [Clostridioides difficile]EGT4225512.1 BlaI/MecI/CopY family transcriptional regulator [Clostridioides difficile]EGT4225787.1 BlaI/MecI/CopY family transcriptional regulator [Clostridioides difficile]MDV9760320.1 BlaI/MecI/CopY family transcriptional regulator [Clostridioi
MKINKLPHAELKLMKYIWGVDDVLASRDIIEAMKLKYDWKKSTTLTFLKTLVDKGFLTTDKVDRCTHYTIAIKEKDYLKVETKSFFSFMHNNSFKSFISALHDDEVLDSKLLDKLEEYFKNLQEEGIDD